MALEWRMPFEEFAAHINQVFKRIIRNRETVVVETEGEDVVTIHAGELDVEEKPGTAKTDTDDQAFLASAGSWQDLDVEKFLNDIYASRDHGSRPPVEL